MLIHGDWRQAVTALLRIATTIVLGQHKSNPTSHAGIFRGTIRHDAKLPESWLKHVKYRQNYYNFWTNSCKKFLLGGGNG